ncbi:MAG: dNTP triphosphohydrolase [Melioribacteraceae bacterium]
MKNKFYNDFDIDRLKHNTRIDDYRTAFQIDRDRIIHSSEFRRLQGKTQVFLPGEFDFYRTRLTHSIEVAQIGRSICNFLLSKETGLFNEEYFIDPDLVESICLAHDLGHPPFGHSGERILNNLMQPFGGFEGNAQTLRSITDIFYREDDHHRSMNPTRAFLDGILKYKALHKDFTKPENHFLYDEQAEIIKYVFDKKDYSKQFKSPEARNNFKSIECQIMDWADDTAYAINDLVDSISGGFINIAKLTKWAENNNVIGEDEKSINDMVEWIKKRKFKAKFGYQIGEFIRSVKIEKRKTFLDKKTNRYKYILVIEPEIFNKVELYKKIAVDIVFKSTQLHQMEYKGNKMVESLFDVFHSGYIKNNHKFKILPEFNDKLVRDAKSKKEKARLICDYISGMTDAYAMRTYKRLFDADYSSLADLIT